MDWETADACGLPARSWRRWNFEVRFCFASPDDEGAFPFPFPFPFPFRDEPADCSDSYEHHNIDEPAILLGGGFVVADEEQPR